MRPIKTLIIDDEPKARSVLIKLLGTYCPGENLIDQAGNLKHALEKIRRDPPELLFLDIHLHKENGFDLLHEIRHLDTHVIFVTAHDGYALRACRESATDYLLKPVDPDELVAAVQKVARKLRKENRAEPVESPIPQVPLPKTPKRIMLKTADSIYVVHPQDILYCRSDRNYTYFYLADGRRILLSKTLSECAEMIDDPAFMRTHQSFLVNMNRVVQYQKGDGGTLVTTNGDSIAVSVRRKEQVMQFFLNL